MRREDDVSGLRSVRVGFGLGEQDATCIALREVLTRQGEALVNMGLGCFSCNANKLLRHAERTNSLFECLICFADTCVFGCSAFVVVTVIVAVMVIVIRSVTVIIIKEPNDNHNNKNNTDNDNDGNDNNNNVNDNNDNLAAMLQNSRRRIQPM